MRQVIGIVLLLNAVAVVAAALTGNLPNWPPAQADIHVAEQAGTPLIHLGGDEAPSAGGVISIWNDISISNSIFTAWLVMAVLVVLGVVASRAVSEVPGRFQGFIELIVQALVDFMKDAGGPAGSPGIDSPGGRCRNSSVRLPYRWGALSVGPLTQSPAMSARRPPRTRVWSSARRSRMDDTTVASSRGMACRTARTPGMGVRPSSNQTRSDRTA